MFEKKKMKKCPCQKSALLVKIGKGDISTFMILWFHANPSKISWDPNIYEPGLF